MAGVGFFEFVLLFIIGLLVLGPERLPRVAMQIGRWVGRARRTANQLRYQIEREVALADITKPPKPKDSPKSGKPDEGATTPSTETETKTDTDTSSSQSDRSGAKVSGASDRSSGESVAEETTTTGSSAK